MFYGNKHLILQIQDDLKSEIKKCNNIKKVEKIYIQ